MKFADKKVAAKAKKAPKAKKESTGKKGRSSAYDGKKIYLLKTHEESGLRGSGLTFDCFKAIKEGITVEKYRENAPNSALARKVLADFIEKKIVKVA